MMERKVTLRRKPSDVVREQRDAIQKATGNPHIAGVSPFDSGALTLNFDGEELQLDYAQHLSIDEEDLNSELSQQPSLYVWYARLLGMQKALVDTAKNALREQEGRLYTLIRNRLEQTLGRRPAQVEVDARLNQDAQLKERRQNLIELQLQLDVLWGIRDSMAQKKDCLLSLAHNRRAEMSLDLHVNKTTQLERSFRNSRNKAAKE